jgi:hypothetical protein
MSARKTERRFARLGASFGFSAKRRMEGCFREAVRRRSGVSLLLEELSARELCYAGVAYQLVTCKDSKVFYAVGEKLERAMLLEKYLASSQLLTEFFK